MTVDPAGRPRREIDQPETPARPHDLGSSIASSATRCPWMRRHTRRRSVALTVLAGTGDRVRLWPEQHAGQLRSRLGSASDLPAGGSAASRTEDFLTETGLHESPQRLEESLETIHNQTKR